MDDLHFHPMWNNDYPESDNIDDTSLWDMESQIQSMVSETLKSTTPKKSGVSDLNIWHLDVGDVLEHKTTKNQIKIESFTSDRAYVRIIDLPYSAMARNIKFLDLVENYEFKKYTAVKVSSGCECGASHTAFKNHHSNWCPLFKNK